jgi:gluconolactonase
MNRIRWWSISAAAVLVCCVVVAQEKKEKKEKPTQVVEVQDIKLTVPKAWKQEPPSNKLRLTQFKLAAVEGDKEVAELAISQFGGGGGAIGDNIKRWVNQFDPKDRKARITKGKSPQGEYIFVDLTGAYIPPPFEQKKGPIAGQRMLGVMLMAEDKGLYFLKLLGPEKTVTEAATDLRSSFGAKADDEKEFKLE